MAYRLRFLADLDFERERDRGRSLRSASGNDILAGSSSSSPSHAVDASVVAVGLISAKLPFVGRIVGARSDNDLFVGPPLLPLVRVFISIDDAILSIDTVASRMGQQ